MLPKSPTLIENEVVLLLACYFEYSTNPV